MDYGSDYLFYIVEFLGILTIITDLGFKGLGYVYLLGKNIVKYSFKMRGVIFITFLFRGSYPHKNIQLIYQIQKGF
jgi:hypothetical protein